MVTEEMKAKRLEMLLDRAFRLDKRIRKASKGEYYSYIRAESFDSREKELSILKERIEQAIDTFFKQEISNEVRENLKILVSLNAQANNSDDIDYVIERGLVVTKQFK
ncbi:hypothetical protein [uncultured Planktosalinus sp.]|uniref:hypothetical protein n=1 Tax=uncultured Planktosalinus sp. TaxID=1810935 RepID=UPI0030D9BA78